MSRFEVELELAETAARSPAQGDFLRWVSATLEQQRPGEPLRVHIRIAGEVEVAGLNHRYRGRNSPTNVLSFPVAEPVEDGVLLLGDLVLCAAVIEREADEQRKPVLHHWAHMAVHGTLHLLGFDHQEEDEAEYMESCERAILAGFGIPDPYAADNNDSPEAAA